jgi:hypothetical protein
VWSAQLYTNSSRHEYFEPGRSSARTALGGSCRLREPRMCVLGGSRFVPPGSSRAPWLEGPRAATLGLYGVSTRSSS